MASHNELNDLLETIRKELPGRAHEAYEQAVKKAMQQRRHHRGGRNLTWEMIERGLPPMFQQRKQKQDEGLMPLFTLLIGFIGGAALMYLFDPDRGARRRAMIQVEARKVVNEASEAVEETAEKVRAEVNRVVGEAEDKAEEVRDQLEDTAEDAAKQVKAVVKDVKQTASDAANNTNTSAPANGTPNPTIGTTRPPTSVTGTSGTDS